MVLQCVHLDHAGHYQNFRNELTQKRRNEHTLTMATQTLRVGGPSGVLGILDKPQMLCPEFVIPKDHQGAKSDAKAKGLYSS